MMSFTTPTQRGIRWRLLSSVLRALLLSALACNAQPTSTQSLSTPEQSTSFPAHSTSQQVSALPTSTSCVDWTLVPVTRDGQTTRASISCFRWTVVPVFMTSTIASTTTVPSSTATIDPTDERNQPTDPAEVHDALYDYTLPYGLPGLIGHFFFFVETSLEAMTIWPDNLSRNHLIKPIVTGVSVAGNIVVACITMFMCRHTWQLVVVGVWIIPTLLAYGYLATRRWFTTQEEQKAQNHAQGVSRGLLEYLKNEALLPVILWLALQCFASVLGSIGLLTWVRQVYYDNPQLRDATLLWGIWIAFIFITIFIGFFWAQADGPLVDFRKLPEIAGVTPYQTWLCTKLVNWGSTTLFLYGISSVFYSDVALPARAGRTLLQMPKGSKKLALFWVSFVLQVLPFLARLVLLKPKPSDQIVWREVVWGPVATVDTDQSQRTLVDVANTRSAVQVQPPTSRHASLADANRSPHIATLDADQLQHIKADVATRRNAILQKQGQPPTSGHASLVDADRSQHTVTNVAARDAMGQVQVRPPTLPPHAMPGSSDGYLIDRVRGHGDTGPLDSWPNF